MCRDPWFLKFTKTYIICGYNRSPSIPEFDKRPRFWNLFCRIWSQNQDFGLKLAASILTRRGASIGTHSDPHFPPDLTQNGFGILGVWASDFPMCCLIISLNSITLGHITTRFELAWPHLLTSAFLRAASCSVYRSSADEVAG